MEIYFTFEFDWIEDRYFPSSLEGSTDPIPINQPLSNWTPAKMFYDTYLTTRISNYLPGQAEFQDGTTVMFYVEEKQDFFLYFNIQLYVV